MPDMLLAATIPFPSLAAAAALAVACAVLSVLVVSRRWAFIGEGISHSAVGGAGTAWVLMLAFPALLGRPWVQPAAIVVFCVGTALGIGFLSRRERVNSDAAIGIFLVASLAWGYAAQQLFRARTNLDPQFMDLLFGRFEAVSTGQALAAVAISAVVLLTLAGLGKEILYYCFDPAMAEASGVRAGAMHYLLMVLIALAILIGIPVVGSVLVTALLVLPGTTAMLLSSRLRNVVGLSVAIGLAGAVGGLLVHMQWRVIPRGPAVVLVLCGLFAIAYGWSKTRRTAV